MQKLIKKINKNHMAYIMGGHLYEEDGGAPANASSSGNIAGMGVTPEGKPSNWSEPGVSPAAQRKHKRRILRRKRLFEEESCGCQKGKFAGEQTFIVPAGVFLEARVSRCKGKHWTNYIGEDTLGREIREYYHNHKGKKPIILQCENTGALCYAHFGTR